MRDDDPFDRIDENDLVLAGESFRRRGVTLRRGLLGFRFTGGSWDGHTQLPFKPRGLYIWNAPPGAQIVFACISNKIQVLFSSAPAPARWFSTGENYDQIRKLLDEGKEPPEWCDWDVVQPGDVVRITIHTADETPASGIDLCMWGTAITS